ncbi:hypothetical protein BJ964_009583 [Actinoplanes lobatus]|uniref:Uncharacterized protein n=1 Tax=Actinoplanes lobatus TaxID=113568 RepID=A0A7W7MLX2_9ACTN|nr:hypothetical protein [Actinoplanes lobatus]
MTNTCVICERPTPDGEACHQCARDLAETLREAAGHAEDAWTVIARQTRYGAGSRGGREQPPIVDFTAADDYAAARNTLTTWILHVIEQDGPTIPTPQRAAGPVCALQCGHVSCRALQRPTPPIPLADATRWLADQTTWLRTRPEAEQAFDELGYACQILTRLVDRPEPPQLRLVGMCDCGKILYARHGVDVVECKGEHCGATWHVDRSQTILRAALDERLVTAGEAAHLAGYLDTDRSAKQIRALVDVWGKRGRINPADHVLVKHTHRGCDDDCAEVRDIVPVYRFGDIAALMATAERRVTQSNQTCSS